MKKTVTTIVAALLCATVFSQTLPVDQRIVFSLSMLSNIPGSTTGGYPNVFDQQAPVKRIIAYASPKIDSALQFATDTSSGSVLSLSGWKRVWGPAVTTAWGDPLNVATFGRLVAANSMTIFADAAKQNYVVAIQATNPYCPYDWDTLDFNVSQKRRWFYDTTTSGYLSLGTFLGINNQLALKDQSTGVTALSFLTSAIKGSGKAVNVTVTGHSLGGALSPVFALYLKQYFAANKISNNTIYCLSTAGATPGDSAFAAYYNSYLQSNTVRIWNFYDAVPRAWGSNLLDSIQSSMPAYGGLYSGASGSVFFDPTYAPCKKNPKQPTAFQPMKTPDYVNFLVDYAEGQAANSGVKYTPICNGGISFPGASVYNPGSIYVDVAPDTALNAEINAFMALIGRNDINVKDTTGFLPEIGAQHIAAYCLYFQMKGIHEYVRAMVQHDKQSIVNICSLIGADDKQAHAKALATMKAKPIKPYSVLLRAIYQKAWGR